MNVGGEYFFAINRASADVRYKTNGKSLPTQRLQSESSKSLSIQALLIKKGIGPLPTQKLQSENNKLPQKTLPQETSIKNDNLASQENVNSLDQYGKLLIKTAEVSIYQRSYGDIVSYENDIFSNPIKNTKQIIYDNTEVGGQTLEDKYKAFVNFNKELYTYLTKL